ncbi:MAG: hypothetical protein WBP41_12710 [Saprospiraceae bacterium]
MGRKLKVKFNIKGPAPKPTDATIGSHYGCFDEGAAGEWRYADRNTSYPNDRQGWGYTNIVIFTDTDDSKARLCAPEPPFGSDGWFEVLKSQFNSLFK